jgi:hypothetical protein
MGQLTAIQEIVAAVCAVPALSAISHLPDYSTTCPAFPLAARQFGRKETFQSAAGTTGPPGCAQRRSGTSQLMLVAWGT